MAQTADDTNKKTPQSQAVEDDKATIQRQADQRARDNVAPDAPENEDPMYESNTGTGPVVVEQGGEGRIEVVQGGRPVEEVQFDRQDLWLRGEGFQERVEVVVNFDSTDGGETNARVSKWTEDGTFLFQLPDFVRPATYRITAYVPQEYVGVSAPDDHTRTMKMPAQTTVTIRPVRV